MSNTELFEASCGKDFWCSIFNPKCVRGQPLPPCRSYCQNILNSCKYETVDVRSFLDCNILPESNDTSVCQQDPFQHGKCHNKMLDQRCRALGYDTVTFPNFAGQRNMFAAVELTTMIDIINNGTHCFDFSLTFACYTLMPKCSGKPVPKPCHTALQEPLQCVQRKMCRIFGHFLGQLARGPGL
ncbi:hypothetical protein DPMN_041194 [Dreissena polymorpha]|uniref:FZ domain-containing protein n=1 Tax=Dreissena polymorpha TaxID=45954 RepID=A0A9D4CZR7_DREPO|nr:hypothetical protein DPMN_041194 [Dreissena polymorpha]